MEVSKRSVWLAARRKLDQGQVAADIDIVVVDAVADIAEEYSQHLDDELLAGGSKSRTSPPWVADAGSVESRSGYVDLREQESPGCSIRSVSSDQA